MKKGCGGGKEGGKVDGWQSLNEEGKRKRGQEEKRGNKKRALMKERGKGGERSV